MRRSPVENAPSKLPRFSGVTRSLTKVMPCSIQGFRAASFGSKSIIVIRLGSTLRCLSKMGSVQRATAPKPTNKIRFGNASIRYPSPFDDQSKLTGARG